MSPDKPKPTHSPRHPGDQPDTHPPSFERMLADSSADPRLGAAALALHRELTEQYGADSAVDRALVESAAGSYYVQQLLTSWTAGLATLLERDLFRRIESESRPLSIHSLSLPDYGNSLRRFSDQVVLQERATRNLARSLAALRKRARQSHKAPAP